MIEITVVKRFVEILRYSNPMVVGQAIVAASNGDVAIAASEQRSEQGRQKTWGCRPVFGSDSRFY